MAVFPFSLEVENDMKEVKRKSITPFNLADSKKDLEMPCVLLLVMYDWCWQQLAISAFCALVAHDFD